MSAASESIHLIDSSIYIFRAWQSQPVSLLSRDGRPFNAVKGFAEFLCLILERSQPSHVLCAFDECLRRGIRHQIYPDYKADRPEAPEDLQWQFACCKATAVAFGIKAIGHSQIEADDIVGQLADTAHQAGKSVTIVTGDKDLAQFIRPGDSYWDVGRQPPKGYDDLCKRFRIKPEQIADWLALTGDRSDNIPGVPGVGPATAARLLTRWQDIDTLMANLGEVANMQFRGAPRVSRLLYEYRDNVTLARQLTGLIRADDLPDSIAPLARRQPEHKDLMNGLCAIGYTDALAESIAKRYAATFVAARHARPATDRAE